MYYIESFDVEQYKGYFENTDAYMLTGSTEIVESFDNLEQAEKSFKSYTSEAYNTTCSVNKHHLREYALQYYDNDTDDTECIALTTFEHLNNNEFEDIYEFHYFWDNNLDINKFRKNSNGKYELITG